MVRRVYVEKKEKFAVEAFAIKQDIQENLGISSLETVRIFHCYDVEGLDEETFDAMCEHVFSEPALDDIYIEELPKNLQGEQIVVAYLPGQFDQRADSAMQCIQLITQQERPAVQSSKVLILDGISKQERKQITNYIINPIDSHEIDITKPNSLQLKVNEVANVAVVDGFIGYDENQITTFYCEMGLAMTLADLKWIQDYFRDTEKRDPTITEIRVIDTYWSDHCRHTTFQTTLESIDIEQEEDNPIHQAILNAWKDYQKIRVELYGQDTKKNITLMDIAVIGTKKLKHDKMVTDIDESEEINACSIRVDVEIDGEKVPYLIMFKNETHNHPTEIEPFGGAATCLGGAIRDPLSGRSYVYQAMRITGSADPRETTNNTLAGKLPQRKITKGAADGYSSYGNQIGLATGLVREIYHDGYKAKRMEIGAVIAATPAENVRREQPKTGDVVLLLGGRTGRDGIGGATGSSKAHTEESIAVCGAQVQKGNPITERKLQRLYRNPEFSKRIKRCNDFGAGGVCVAIGELAPSITIDLDAVPKKYEGLDGTELAISESQERMAIVVCQEDVQRMMALAQEENVECTAVATITDRNRLIMTWRGQTIVDVDRSFLDTNGVSQTAKVAVTIPNQQDDLFCKKTAFSEEKAKHFLSELNHCSQQGLAEQFDATIGAGTVLMPFGGRNQRTPAQAMVALIPSDHGISETATIMSYGFDPLIAMWSPLHGASYAVLDSLAKIVASGGAYEKARLTFQEYYERLGEDATRWGKPFIALLGALQAQVAMGTPAIGGKDSMSGTFDDLSVPPTLVSFAIAPVEANVVLSNEWKQANHEVFLFQLHRDEAGLPDYEKMKRQFEQIRQLNIEGKIVSASAVSTLLQTVSESCFGNELGFAFINGYELDYFAPMYGAILVECVAGCTPQGALHIGRITDDFMMEIEGEQYSLQEWQAVWQETLEPVFQSKTKRTGTCMEGQYMLRNESTPAVIVNQPKAVIPVLPGTNCEYDTTRALMEAGADVDVVVIKNANANEIERSVDELAKKISDSQMMILPGGFSGGDEPDGSAKFFTALLRAPQIEEEVQRLLQARDGLMLGICNGFQALIKVGLVPYGKMTNMNAKSPTLAHNEIGRHVSRLALTRVSSVKSPWMRFCEVGEVYNVAMSHGEGRFVASDEEIKQLFDNGQIITQYVQKEGRPTMDGEYNINGSYEAIEGICSPDGRVVGKMGHVERIGKHVHKNVPGMMDMQMFRAGVAYFRNE